MPILEMTEGGGLHLIVLIVTAEVLTCDDFLDMLATGCERSVLSGNVFDDFSIDGHGGTCKLTLFYCGLLHLPGMCSHV